MRGVADSRISIILRPGSSSSGSSNSEGVPKEMGLRLEPGLKVGADLIKKEERNLIPYVHTCMYVCIMYMYMSVQECACL